MGKNQRRNVAPLLKVWGRMSLPSGALRNQVGRVLGTHPALMGSLKLCVGGTPSLQALTINIKARLPSDTYEYCASNMKSTLHDSVACIPVSSGYVSRIPQLEFAGLESQVPQVLTPVSPRATPLLCYLLFDNA